MAPFHAHAHIKWHETLDSTNRELRRHIESCDNLSIVAARSQTEGRGQGDHRWTSNAGENLTFSILMRFGTGLIHARDERVINDYVTPVLVSFLAREGVEAWVKKPNDIWVEDKKIAGILIENILDGEYVSCSIIGIGLNLNQKLWPEELPNPVSLTQLTGKEYSPEEVLEDLASCFEVQYTDRISCQGHPR